MKQKELNEKFRSFFGRDNARFLRQQDRTEEQIEKKNYFLIKQRAEEKASARNLQGGNFGQT